MKALIEEEGNDELKLRVFVTGGGCSGLQYGFTFDEVANEDDTVMQKNGVSLLIDPMSYQYLRRRRDRLHRGAGGRAVRDQESERDLDLRVRIVVLRLTRRVSAREQGGLGSLCFFRPGRPRRALAASRAR